VVAAGVFLIALAVVASAGSVVPVGSDDKLHTPHA